VKLTAEQIPPQVRADYVAEGLWSQSCLRDGLEAHAARTPDAVALVEATESWSYRQLADATATAVGALRQRRVGPESVVLVVAPVSIPALACYLAVLRAGAVAVMLDRRCGRADVAQAVEAARADVVVCPPELIDRLAVVGLGRPTVTFEELLRCPDPVLDWEEPDPDRPAAAVFTSGTTSRPKCVVHSLNTLRSGARNLGDVLELTAADVAFLSSPLAGITGLLQTHLMIDRGAALVLEDRFDPVGSLARLRKHGATILGGAPVIIEELFKQAAREGIADLPLRAMALGGAMIPRETLELAVARYGITPVRMYGASEIPAATGTLPTDRGARRLDDDGACSRGTEVRLGGGASGEVEVRGPMRCLGYLDDRDNAGTFVEGGWYRSGDVGRIENGRLKIVGRLKEIVSRKGLKLSLSEIDEVTRSMPGVAEVAAFGLPDPDTGERLAIAVRGEDPSAITFESVIGWLLGAGLATWKLPEQIVLWDGPLPRTGSGKVQRRLLVEGAADRPSLLAPRLR
jgi:acyl-CoA synthetase (AMP-forming)/AMP-acid ligase II